MYVYHAAWYFSSFYWYAPDIIDTLFYKSLEWLKIFLNVFERRSAAQETLLLLL